MGRDGVPLWIGAVTFDRSVGFSHLTGQITHHIGADIDAERDGLVGDLRKAGCLTELFQARASGRPWWAATGAAIGTTPTAN